MWILIQARTNSTRLPNKCMLKIDGQPIIKHVIDIAKSVARTCVVIPVGDPLAGWLRNQKQLFIEGSEDNVLDRYYMAARMLNAKHVVRLTADCPLIPVSQLAYLAGASFQNNLDWCTNLPTVDGWDIQIASMRCLDWVWKTAKSEYDREHVFTFLNDKKEKMKQMGFKTAWIREPILTEWIPKLSIDTKEDYESVRNIYVKLKKQLAGAG